MALTAATVHSRVKQILYGDDPRTRPYTFALTGTPSPTTEFDVVDAGAFQVGDILEAFDSTAERILVTGVNTSTNVLTVKRDIDNLGGTTLFSSGDLLVKNPRFSNRVITEAIDQVIDELEGDGIHAILSETVAVTTDDWYDVTDTAMDDVYSVWYIEDGEFRMPLFVFMTDPANIQPKLFVGAAGFTGNVHCNYRRPYASITELPDRLMGLVVNGAVYKLMGAQGVRSTTDPGKRSDRTVQVGQETRDSYWFLAEYRRLRDKEILVQKRQIDKLPKDRVSQRARRYRA